MWHMRNNPFKSKFACVKRGEVRFLFLQRENPTSWPQKGSPDPPPSLLKIFDLQCYIKINYISPKLDI